LHILVCGYDTKLKSPTSRLIMKSHGCKAYCFFTRELSSVIWTMHKLCKIWVQTPVNKKKKILFLLHEERKEKENKTNKIKWLKRIRLKDHPIKHMINMIGFIGHNKLIWTINYSLVKMSAHNYFLEGYDEYQEFNVL